MSFPNERTYSFDANMLLSDNAAAYVATGFAQVGGADAILDLGGNQGTTPKQQARMAMVAVVDITAIAIGGAADQKYNLQFLGSNDPAFAAGNVEMLSEYSFGKGGSRDGTNMVDSVIGRYELPFVTEVAGTKYQYVKARWVISGTAPSISALAFGAVLPEP